MKIRKGDTVRVLSGKDRGIEGEVVSADPRRGRVLVDGVHVAAKHQKPTRANESGGIIDKIMPIDVSNVAIVCGSCGEPTRVGYRFDGDEKVRRCKKCGEDL